MQCNYDQCCSFRTPNLKLRTYEAKTKKLPEKEYGVMSSDEYDQYVCKNQVIQGDIVLVLCMGISETVRDRTNL